MNYSTPIAGIQSASAAFDSASNAIVQAFNGGGSRSVSASSAGDTVDLSTEVAAMLKSKTDFMANVQMEIVDNAMTKSTFSLLA